MGTLDHLPMMNIIASPDNWIEGEAVEQLKQTAKLPGMSMAIGMPDLHPGKGSPIGAAFFSQNIVYPYLVGNDVGCGMGLWQTELKQNKIKRDQWVKKLHGLESPWEADIEAWIAQEGLLPKKANHALGTIGGGNHFAELQIIDTIQDTELFNKTSLIKNQLVLLVHSGSRGLGEELLRKHADQFKDAGLDEGSEEAKHYREEHDYAVKWARSNRSLIAHRFLTLIGTDGTCILDVCHNSVTSKVINNRSGWLHRKGAAPSDEGFIVIPGSRGSFSYLVHPTGAQDNNCFSLAHGAGRKWNRSESKSRLKKKYSIESLLQTKLGSKVICEDKNLLYEEAPQAYKNIDIVVNDLQEAGLLTIVALLKPLITYKTRRR